MLITAPWRDPISGRWITPRAPAPAPSAPPEPVDHYAAAERDIRIAKTWQAVVATAAASSIADQHQE